MAGTQDRLSVYRGKRDPRRTPEPVPDGPLPQGNDDTFVVQEHHARRLHWDFRLERGGVLVSWAVPKGLPMDPRQNHLAVPTEDHPLEYAAFAGEIPHGQYGGGRVTIWDRGTYETQKWRPDEVIVVLHGARVQGRYALFRTGQDWLMHRMDPPPHPDWEPMPALVRPMLATPGTLPPAAQDQRWAYEMKWDGVRAVVYVDGGRARALTRNDREVTSTYPELRELGAVLGSTAVVLDGELVALNAEGRPDFGVLQQRMHVQRPSRALLAAVPVSYLIFDVLWLQGRSLLAAPYAERRSTLESLDLVGTRWDTPAVFLGSGAQALAASRAAGLEGVVAKRIDSRYEPGARSRAWVKVKHQRTQEVVVGGWQPGEGRRSGGIGSLLVGIPGPSGLEYVGNVGTGFSVADLSRLGGLLRPYLRKTSPFCTEVPRLQARNAVWVTPRLVGEVAFAEWTRDGRMRHPSWRGLRPDKTVADVVRES